LIQYYILFKLIIQNVRINGDWGLGIGDWGLGIGDWAQSPIPNPQSPIPNPQLYLFLSYIKNSLNLIIIYKKYNISKNN